MTTKIRIHGNDGTSIPKVKVPPEIWGSFAVMNTCTAHTFAEMTSPGYTFENG
jgi:hypothetical protein